MMYGPKKLRCLFQGLSGVRSEEMTLGQTLRRYSSLLQQLCGRLGVRRSHKRRYCISYYPHIVHNNIGQMEMVAAIAVLCCVVAGLWWWWWLQGKARSSRRPPGPRGLPIIGNLHQLGGLPHQALARLSQIHGPLMSLRLGSQPLLVASSPHTANLILHSHDKLLAGRPLHLSAPSRIMGPSSPNILFHQPDPYWKLMRQICVSDFFSKKRLDHFRPVRMSEVRSLLRSILPLQGHPLTFRSLLHTATSNIISTMALGQPLHQFISADGPNSTLDITSVLLDIKSSLGMFEIGDYIPWLAWLDLQGYRKRDRQVARNARVVFQKVIDRRRQETKSTSGHSPPQDFLDLLLSKSADAVNNMEDANIRAVLIDMFVAGTDTSVVSLEWALAELLSNPEKLWKLQQELDEVVGASRIVEESDMQNLPYLRAVVNEALRLHPVGPLLVPHRSLEECEIEGYTIAANTTVYVNAWAVQRDPSAWENPLEFCPDRFLDSPLLDAIPGQHFQLIPFGAGRRSCPGWKLGLMTVQIMLANLIHTFHWTVPGSGKPSMKEKFGIAVALEEPLVAVASLRLSSDALT